MTPSNTEGVNRTSSRNGSLLESVRQENRVDINEIWNTPPSSLPQRPENGINTNRRWESSTPVREANTLPVREANTLPVREANTLPATRNLNSYFPWLGQERHQTAHEYALAQEGGLSWTANNRTTQKVF